MTIEGIANLRGSFLPTTPEAFANSSPGFELARTLGQQRKTVITLKGFANR